MEAAVIMFRGGIKMRSAASLFKNPPGSSKIVYASPGVFQNITIEQTDRIGINRREGDIERPVRRLAGQSAGGTRSDMHAPQSLASLDQAKAQGSNRGADHIAPDCAGQNFYVRAGRVRTDVSDQRDRHFDPSHTQVRQRRAQGLSVAEDAVGRCCDAVERHPVHDYGSLRSQGRLIENSICDSPALAGEGRGGGAASELDVAW